MLAYPQAEVERELREGERLLWSGQPKQGIRLRLADCLVIPFSLFWCGFAIFWETEAIVIGGPWFFAVWGIPFVAVGLYLVFGRFVVDARIRRTSYYGVTDSRVIIVSGLFTRKVKSLNLGFVGGLSLSEKSDGSGSITFVQTNPNLDWFSVGGWPGAKQYAVPTFDMVADVRQVYELICEAQRALSSTGGGG